MNASQVLVHGTLNSRYLECHGLVPWFVTLAVYKRLPLPKNATGLSRG